PGGYRRLATAVEAFVGVRPAPQERCASLAAGRTDKPLRPTPLEQERRTARLVRKARLKLSQRSRPSHPVPPRARRISPAHGTSYYMLTNLGQRDEPCVATSRLSSVTVDSTLRSICGMFVRTLAEHPGDPMFFRFP